MMLGRSGILVCFSLAHVSLGATALQRLELYQTAPAFKSRTSHVLHGMRVDRVGMRNMDVTTEDGHRNSGVSGVSSLTCHEIRLSLDQSGSPRRSLRHGLPESHLRYVIRAPFFHHLGETSTVVDAGVVVSPSRLS
jgi:hypothetical protein